MQLCRGHMLRHSSLLHTCRRHVPQPSTPIHTRREIYGLRYVLTDSVLTDPVPYLRTSVLTSSVHSVFRIAYCALDVRQNQV